MSSKQTTTQNQQTDPWKPAQAGLQDVLTKAQTLGSQTGLFTPVQGTTTQQALGQMTDIANQGSQALPALQSVVNGSVQGYGGGLDQMLATARGDNLSSVPPYLQKALDDASGKTANLVNQQFAGAGRYGSANHAGVIADRVGTIQTQGLLDNYYKEREAQLTAANQLYQGGYQGAALAPQIDASRTFGANLLGQVGAQQDAYQTGVQQAPLRAAEWQSGLVTPIAQLGQTSSGTTTSKTSNPVGTAVGIGSTLAGLATGGMGSLAGGGGLFSMFTGGSAPQGSLPWQSGYSPMLSMMSGNYSGR